MFYLIIPDQAIKIGMTPFCMKITKNVLGEEPKDTPLITIVLDTVILSIHIKIQMRFKQGCSICI